MSQPPYPGPPYPEQPYSGQPSSGQPYSGQPSSGQPYPGQPYPGQPSSGQPYSGQPYPGQPSSGQPYPGQPYQGQPNPDVPSSVPPQPGYPSSAPPAPAYGQQPDYGQQPTYAQQPGYGQTEYVQSGYVQQPGYPAPQPPKKSKALPIVLVSIAVVLVLCVGGSLAVFLAAKNKADDVSDGVERALATPTATTDPTATPTEEASTITIVEPKTLGGRPKLTDEQFAGIADELKSGLADVPDAGNTVGALYGTVSKQNIVVIAAAEAPVDDPKKELDGTFLGAGIGGLKVTGITTVDAGALGGAAKCGNADASGVKMAMCGWADEGSIGWIIWYFKSASQVKSEFPKLRAQIEKSS